MKAVMRALRATGITAVVAVYCMNAIAAQDTGLQPTVALETQSLLTSDSPPIVLGQLKAQILGGNLQLLLSLTQDSCYITSSTLCNVGTFTTKGKTMLPYTIPFEDVYKFSCMYQEDFFLITGHIQVNCGEELVGLVGTAGGTSKNSVRRLQDEAYSYEAYYEIQVGCEQAASTTTEDPGKETTTTTTTTTTTEAPQGPTPGPTGGTTTTDGPGGAQEGETTAEPTTTTTATSTTTTEEPTSTTTTTEEPFTTTTTTEEPTTTSTTTTSTTTTTEEPTTTSTTTTTTTTTTEEPTTTTTSTTTTTTEEPTTTTTTTTTQEPTTTTTTTTTQEPTTTTTTTTTQEPTTTTEVPTTTTEEPSTATPSCETAFAYAPSSNSAGDDGLCFLNAGIKTNRWGWTIGPLTPGSAFTYEVYAGAGQCDIKKGAHAAYVGIDYNKGTVVVTQKMLPNWTMQEYHVYVGTDKFPTMKNKVSVAPGQYTVVENSPANSKGFQETFANMKSPVYVIVHSVACTGTQAGTNGPTTSEGPGGAPQGSTTAAPTTPTTEAPTTTTTEEPTTTTEVPTTTTEEACTKTCKDGEFLKEDGCECVKDACDACPLGSVCDCTVDAYGKKRNFCTSCNCGFCRGGKNCCRLQSEQAAANGNPNCVPNLTGTDNCHLNEFFESSGNSAQVCRGTEKPGNNVSKRRRLGGKPGKDVEDSGGKEKAVTKETGGGNKDRGCLEVNADVETLVSECGCVPSSKGLCIINPPANGCIIDI